MSEPTTTNELAKEKNSLIPYINSIVNAAQSATDVSKMEAIGKLAERMLALESEREYSRAMASLQAELPVIIKDAVNPSLKSTYAKLETIDQLTRPSLSRHGFSVSYSEEPGTSETNISLSMEVRHFGGHKETRRIIMPRNIAPKNKDNKAILSPCQEHGVTLSYAKRYAFCNFFNIIPANEDRDGQYEETQPEPQRLPEPETIDEKQLAEINDLVLRSGTDVPKFLSHFKLEAFHKILAKDFKKIKVALEQKLKVEEAKKAQQPAQV